MTPSSPATGPSGGGRLLVVVPHATRTGSTRVLLDLLRAGAGDLAVPLAISLGAGGPLADELAALGSPPDPLERPAAVLANTCLSADRLLAVDPSVPTAVYVHEAGEVLASLPGEGRRGLLRADLVLCVSERTAVDLAAIGIDPDRIKVLPPLVRAPSEVGADEVGACRAALGVGTGEHLVIGCGEASHRKGTDLFVEVAGRLGHRDDLHFAWVGRRLRSMSRMLDHDVDALGVGRRLRWVEEVRDPAAHFAAADLLVMTSRSDPQPLVPLEAAAQGCPTVGFAIGGVAELAAVGGARSVPFPDVVGLASAVEQVVDDPALAGTLVVGARRRLAERSDASVVARFVAAIGALLAGPDHRSERP